jgi:hypothetical protein
MRRLQPLFSAWWACRAKWRDLRFFQPEIRGPEIRTEDTLMPAGPILIEGRVLHLLDSAQLAAHQEMALAPSHPQKARTIYVLASITHGEKTFNVRVSSVGDVDAIGSACEVRVTDCARAQVEQVGNASQSTWPNCWRRRSSVEHRQDDDSVGELKERRPLCGGRGDRRSLGSPRFPVKNRSFGELHAALFTESRIRCRW